MAWKTIYEHDANGSPVTGMSDPSRKQELLRAIREGWNIRVVVHPEDDSRLLVASPRVLFVRYGEAFAQISFVLTTIDEKHRNALSFSDQFEDYYLNLSTS